MFILLNKCYGKFGLSDEFLDEYPEYKDKGKWNRNSFRTNEELIERVKYFGLHRAGGNDSNLSIVSIPDDVNWAKNEYGGYEYVEYVKDNKVFDA